MHIVYTYLVNIYKTLYIIVIFANGLYGEVALAKTCESEQQILSVLLFIFFQK